ncbi:MAG: DNA methylase [Clostridiales bacterium]|nr:DNA methylase [Clostridiales bacterium]
MSGKRKYIAIDLKSFYASVECAERRLDPMTTNLVVADLSRTEKTICLAVSPSLKKLGIPGRPRLFEVIQRVKEENIKRKAAAPNRRFTGESYISSELDKRPDLSIGYITAPPRMALYIEYSTKIYNIYLKYAAPEDIHVYSIDEVFIDITAYLDTYKMTAHELTIAIIRDVLKTTGITATAGIGENLYLCKIAMDIVAKKIPADKDGVRIAELDEMSYRRTLWDHRPITDFWRVGRGYAKKLEENGMFTMGDVARCSVGGANDFHNEDLLYRLFGVNAELLIDHAWGWEPCTIAHIKAYKPSSNSLGSGQVLHQPYDFEKAGLIVREMADLLSLDLVDKGLVTNQLVLTVGYDIGNLTDVNIKNSYKGEIATDHYGRKKPKSAHGSINLEDYTSSSKIITAAAAELFISITDKKLLIRRINITANHVIRECDIPDKNKFFQLDLFTDYDELKKQSIEKKTSLSREKRTQEAVIKLKKKFGKNAVIKGMNLQEGATAIDRNNQIGGHKA